MPQMLFQSYNVQGTFPQQNYPVQMSVVSRLRNPGLQDSQVLLLEITVKINENLVKLFAFKMMRSFPPKSCKRNNPMNFPCKLLCLQKRILIIIPDIIWPFIFSCETNYLLIFRRLASPASLSGNDLMQLLENFFK